MVNTVVTVQFNFMSKYINTRLDIYDRLYMNHTIPENSTNMIIYRGNKEALRSGYHFICITGVNIAVTIVIDTLLDTNI